MGGRRSARSAVVVNSNIERSGTLSYIEARAEIALEEVDDVGRNTGGRRKDR